VLAGGGTAGHVTPALAVADALVARGHERSSIVFVGTSRGVGLSLAAERGFATCALAGRGVPRKASLAALAAAGSLAQGMAQSLGLIRRLRPAVVASFGGYGGLGPALAAGLLSIPLVVIEANSVPGAANRVTHRFACAAAVAMAGTRLRREVVTGSPVRPEVVHLAQAGVGSARRAPLDRHLVVIFGGSLGSGRINEVVLAMVRELSDRSDLAVYHVVGERDYREDRYRQAACEGPGLWYRPVAFDPDLASWLAEADLVVCRAGASTVAELTCLGRPSILIPLPSAPGDHQRVNASIMVQAGAAQMLTDGELTPAGLIGRIEALLGRPERLQEMAARAKELGRPGAAEAVADLVEMCAQGLTAPNEFGVGKTG
jgi:undecaprenyldiphospho-muramoylpentapeptide beta-N-acetylglucosaminyltransferase